MRRGAADTEPAAHQLRLIAGDGGDSRIVGFSV
jgi:hypothetical protein